MIMRLIKKINPFKNEPELGTHNWHLESDKVYKSWFFNWRFEHPCVGAWFCVTKDGIDFTISIWWTFHGHYIWNKELRKQALKMRREQNAIDY